MLTVRSFLICALVLTCASRLTAQRITWEQISGSKPAEGLQILNDSVFLSFRSSGDGPFTAYLNRTTDAGKTWTSSVPWGEAYETHDNGQGRARGTSVVDLHFFDDSCGIAFGRLESDPMLHVTSDGGYNWTGLSSLPKQLRSQYTYYVSSDSAHVYFTPRWIDKQDGLFTYNKASKTCSLLLERDVLKLLGVEYVLAVRQFEGTEYLLGIGVNKDLRITYRQVLDTVWYPSIYLDSVASKQSTLTVIDGKLSYSSHRAIVQITGNPLTFDTVVTLPSEILDIASLEDGTLVALLNSPPFIMMRSPDLTWTAQGVPSFSSDRIKAHNNAMYHYYDGGPLFRGSVQNISKRPLQLYLPAYRRDISLPSFNSQLVFKANLQNFGDTITATLFARTKNSIEFDEPTVTLPSLSSDSITIRIAGSHPGVDNAIIGAIVGTDTIILAEWKITAPAPLLRTTDTIRLSRFHKGRDDYYRVPLQNMGQDTLVVTSISSNDYTLFWQGGLVIKPGGVAFLNIPETNVPSEFGWFTIASNSLLSTDTLYYRLDATSIRPTLRHFVPFKNTNSSVDLSIKRMTVQGTTTFVASEVEHSNGDRSLSFFRNAQPDQFYRILELDGTKDIGTDELLSFGNTRLSLSAIVKLSDSTKTAQYYYTFDTSGVIERKDSVNGKIQHAAQVGSHFHLRRQLPSWEEEIGHRIIEHGSFSEAKTDRRTGQLHGNGNYSSQTIASNGDASCILSASDSTGHAYLIGLQDHGYGSYYDRGAYYDTVLVSTRGLNLKGKALFGDQFEVTTNGKPVIRKGLSILLFSVDGHKLFERSYDPVAITTIHTGASESVYVGKQGSFANLLRLNDSGSVSATYEYSNTPYVNHQIRDVQILRNDHAYVLITDGPDVALLHFDSTGTLVNSVHLDGGYLMSDNPVQFIRLDSQVVIALNTKNELGNDEGVLYYFDWDHPYIAPTKRVMRDERVQQSLTLFPNPASTYITLAHHDPLDDIRIIDMLGKSWEATITGSFLDVSYLPTGVYTLESGNNRAKLMIQR